MGSSKSINIMSTAADTRAMPTSVTNMTNPNLDKSKLPTIEPAANNERNEEKEDTVVFWDGDDDPQNPMNFPAWVKNSNVALVSALTFITPLASSMFAPGVSQVMQEFDNKSNVIAELVMSIYILGFAVGPLLLAPLSELYGRLVIYHVSNIGFLAFTVACAESKSIITLVFIRFFQGCFGAAPVTNGGGTIADLVPVAKRGSAMAFYAIGPLLGPVIGPVCGGYITAAKGWRWVFWVILVVDGVFSVLCAVFLRETYAPVILKWKAMRLRKMKNSPNLRSKLDKGLSTRDTFIRAIVRPVKMLILSPVVLLCSIYYAVIYGYLYLMFTTFTPVFQDTYGISTANIGLTFLGIGIGSLIGLFIIGGMSDRLVNNMAKKNATQEHPDGIKKPEYRLPPLIWTSPLIPAGLFMYGWTVEKHIHWIAPIIGTALIGIGNLGVFMCLQTYLVDAFPIFAASAIAVSTVVRSIAGALLPLAGGPIYAALGVGWGNSLLAFIALALLPVPVFFMTYGENLRGKFDTGRL